jgi:hypothetical protein
MKNKSTSAFKRHWQSRIKVIQCVLEGLKGNPFDWATEGETKAYLRLAREMGITLLTKGQIERLGRKLKHGVMPVGTGRFGGRFAPPDFYVLECQTKEVHE